ncbi:MAG: hypothetical protein Q9M89_08610 [Persephonella sp.]|nr:hypothetical protein [Persephonella sp.]
MDKIKNFKVIKIKSLKEINYPQLSCDWRNSIGVKLYRVKVKLTGNYITDYFVDVVKGRDGIYRILNIGTSP